ncbi:hypothetical protein DEU56DRAFT_527069 [Suillus clintonianus]|uniref:uncharacterized protein n=1 Tax=Suillus clintonianus TaxID=1904413 RepID=UPI001B868BA8|nr:uncharacterized protein DEU56DRAFT_527069 [Suillus clintonianus]KAG2127687.1 hypothetical protein DEU56DRAFT_527069 [Suillus clintonianus]
MHRALLVCEILLEICTHVKVNQGRKNKSLVRTSLAALATTCKTFHEPAMNELWADIHGLIPLLGCVTRLRPIIYCTETQHSWHDPAYLGGLEPLSENEAREFLRHAARVRSMNLDLASQRNFRLLSVLPKETCMFPRLQSLVMDIRPTRYLHLFLSPTLRRCVLPDIYPGLTLIVTHCAALEHLCIMDSGKTTAHKLSLQSDSVRMCERLVALSCPPLNWAAWEHLSNLLTLVAVTVNMENIVPSPSDLNNVNFGSFLNLTTLCFRADTAAYITTLMQHSEFPSLKRFGLAVDKLPWAEAKRLFLAMSQCIASQTLEDITIRSYIPGVQDPLGNSLTAITQFCPCTQLRTLELDFPYCCAQLDNDLLFEAMSCWPHIRSLKLEDWRYHQATITFRGLFAALRQCLHLDELSILMDTVNIDIDPAAETFRHTSLQTLYVGTAQVEDTEAVARIIFSMLPCVDEVDISPSGHTNAWREVQEHLNRFKSSSVLDD